MLMLSINFVRLDSRRANKLYVILTFRLRCLETQQFIYLHI